MSNVIYLDFPEPFGLSMRHVRAWMNVLKKHSRQERKQRLILCYQHGILEPWVIDYFFELWNLGEEG